MKIAVFGSEHQNKEQIDQIFKTLHCEGVGVYVHNEFYEYLSSSLGFDQTINGTFSCTNFEADLILTLGGDGTFLHTASAIGTSDIPMLGLNTGRLGFLADVTHADLGCVLEEILRNEYRIERRSQLKLECPNEVFGDENIALNEIAILKQESASMLSIDAYINDEYLTSYESDGLIIATPTGSTAYSLSVGGPIMSPTTSSFLLIAIAPHSLSARPLVIDDDSTIRLKIEGRSDSFLVSLDGRSRTFTTGTELIVSKSEHTLKVIKRKNHTFYNTLRNKLKWGVDPRE